MRLRVLRGERPTAGAEPTPAPSGPTPPWRRLLRVPGPRSIAAALRRNTGLKLVSLLLAFLLWFSINVSERGPRTILDGIDERRERLALDLSDLAPGEERVKLNEGMIRPELPRRLKIIRLEPASVKIRI